MVAFGYNAGDVIPTLQAVGDATAGLGGGTEKLKQISGAFADIQAQGKISLQQINQLSAAGVPALQILANEAGESMGDMSASVTAGTVDSKTAIDGLVMGIEQGTTGSPGRRPPSPG